MIFLPGAPADNATCDSRLQARAEPKKQEKLARQSRYIAGLLGTSLFVGSCVGSFSGAICSVFWCHFTPLSATLLPAWLDAEKAEERKQEQDILYERQLAKERAAGERAPPPGVLSLSLLFSIVSDGFGTLPALASAVLGPCFCLYASPPACSLAAPVHPFITSRGPPVWRQGEVCDGGLPSKAGGAGGLEGGTEAQVSGCFACACAFSVASQLCLFEAGVRNGQILLAG